MRAFSKVLYIEDVHLGTSSFLLPGGKGGGGRGGVRGFWVGSHGFKWELREDKSLSTEYKAEGSLKN